MELPVNRWHAHEDATRLRLVAHYALTAPTVGSVCSSLATTSKRKSNMPATKYRLYRRANGIYYWEDTQTKAQVSLRTKETHAAQEKLRAAERICRITETQPRSRPDLFAGA